MRSSICVNREISRVSQFEPLTESVGTWKKRFQHDFAMFFLNPENSLFNLEYTDSRATKWMQEVKWWKFHEQIPDLVLNSIALRQMSRNLGQD